MSVVLPGIPVQPPSTGGVAPRPTGRTGSTIVPIRPTPSFRVVKIENDATIGGQPGTTIIQTGQITIALSAAAAGSGTVTFDRPFDQTPRVYGTLTARDNYVVSTASISTTSVVIQVRHMDNTAATVNVAVQWIAL